MKLNENYKVPSEVHPYKDGYAEIIMYNINNGNSIILMIFSITKYCIALYNICGFVDIFLKGNNIQH